MNQSEIIKIYLSNTINNAKNLILNCMYYPVPKTYEECLEVERLIEQIHLIKESGIPHGKPYSGMQLTLTRCINELTNKLLEHNINTTMKGEE